MTWKYSRSSGVSVTQLIDAKFYWMFEGDTIARDTVSGANGVLYKNQYKKSGDFGATLVLEINGGSYSIPCSPVHVNGAAITGCKCSTEATSVDFTATPSVEWSVSGCSTGEGMKLAYEWDGTPGTTTFAKTFTAASDGYAPKLKVSNSDNSVVDVACPAVKVTDGPEFEITMAEITGAIKLPKGTSIVSLKVDAYNNSVFCLVSRDDSPTGSLNVTVNKTAIKGWDYVDVPMPAGTLVKGATLEFSLDVPATCGVH